MLYLLGSYLQVFGVIPKKKVFSTFVDGFVVCVLY